MRITGGSGVAVPPGPAQARAIRQLNTFQFAECMRANEVPNYPYPGPGQAHLPAGINPYSPIFLTALRACAPGGGSLISPPPPSLAMPSVPPAVLRVLDTAAGQEFLRLVETQQQVRELHQLEVESAIALGIMTILSGLLGWLVAGRVLRPLRTITATTRDISATRLNKRLALEGPEDELKDLGDTIDALLARLEDSFTAQRAFVANASHELRTPLALSRAMLQFALADPRLTFSDLKATCQDVLDAGSDHEQLIEALLTLARGQQGIEHREPINLAEVVGEVVGAPRPQGIAERITLDTALSPAWVSGDPRLIRQLVSNLVENALHHNTSDGSVQLTVEGPPAPHAPDGGQYRPPRPRRPDRPAAATVPATETGPHRRPGRPRPRTLDRPRDRHRTRRHNPDPPQRRWRATCRCRVPAPSTPRATTSHDGRTRPTRSRVTSPLRDNAATLCQATRLDRPCGATIGRVCRGAA